VPEVNAAARPLRLGVAGPVGTGKSSIIALICRALSGELELAVVTNDIYTDEDARFLRSAGVLEPERIRAVETGACPHTAIRDDVTANLLAVEDLEEEFAPLDVVLVESGGDNLTATFSPALVDAQLFVLDVAGGGDVARKGGPGIARADLLVVNKTDLGPYVGVDVEQMVGDARRARDGRPVLALSRTDPASIDGLSAWVREMLRQHRSGHHVPVDPGPMARHVHADGVEHDHVHGPGHDHRHLQDHVQGRDHQHDHRHEDQRDHQDRIPAAAVRLDAGQAAPAELDAPSTA
jgi:urease accessory protein